MISSRLLQLRNSQGLSQKDFGAIMNIAQTSYANYEKGRSDIPASLLKALALKLNVNLNWLITGEGSMYLDGEAKVEAPELDGITAYIPITTMKLSAGRGWDWDSDESFTGELLPVPIAIAERFNATKLVAATVKGDSMEPTLRDGEPVVYVRNHDGGDGIYALAILDEVYIKRLAIDRLKKEVTIISDNPKYPPKTYPMDQEGLQVLGKVVFWIHVE